MGELRATVGGAQQNKTKAALATTAEITHPLCCLTADSPSTPSPLSSPLPLPRAVTMSSTIKLLVKKSVSAQTGISERATPTRRELSLDCTELS